MPKTLPKESQASLRKGLCLVYQDEENTIMAWSSLLSGKEKVYLNDELVSERRSMDMKSGHAFQDAAGTSYHVKFITIDLKNGSLRCEFIKEGVVEKTFRTQFVKQDNYFMTRLLHIIVFASIIGFSSSLFHLPVWVTIVAIGLFILFFFIIKSPGKLIIEEVIPDEI